MKYYCALEKGNLAICYRMDEPSEHYAKRNKSVTDGNILYDSTPVRNLERPKLIEPERTIVAARY